MKRAKDIGHCPRTQVELRPAAVKSEAGNFLDLAPRGAELARQPIRVEQGEAARYQLWAYRKSSLVDAEYALLNDRGPIDLQSPMVPG